MDDDEGAKIAEMRDVTPAPSAPRPPAPPAPPAIEHQQASEPDTINVSIDGEIIEDEPADADSFVDDDTFLQNLEDALAVAGDEATVEEVWTDADAMARFQNNENMQGIAQSMKRAALKRVGA